MIHAIACKQLPSSSAGMMDCFVIVSPDDFVKKMEGDDDREEDEEEEDEEERGD